MGIPVGAAIHDLSADLFGLPMELHGHRIQIVPWFGLWLEIPEAVDPTDQCSAVFIGIGLPGVRRDIPDRQADSTIIGLVGMGRMGNAIGKKRRFSSVDFKVDGEVFVDSADFLPPGQHVVIMVRVFMSKIRPNVTAGQHPHAPALHGGGRKGYPDRDESV